MVVNQGQSSMGSKGIGLCAAAMGIADVMQFTAGRAALLSGARKVLSEDTGCAALEEE